MGTYCDNSLRYPCFAQILGEHRAALCLLRASPEWPFIDTCAPGSVNLAAST